MSDYYIRSPEQSESRGPFDIGKLNTLAEAAQITQNTLYYDETKEEWLPIGLNPDLRAGVFPEREKLSLKMKESEVDCQPTAVEPEAIKVEAMLAAADGDTEEKRQLTRQRKSLEKAASISAIGLGFMMLLSALYLLLPLVPELATLSKSGNLISALNYPTLLLALFDLIMGILLLLSVTEVYPILRARSMLGLGFGGYIGWSIGDPLLALVSVLACLGIFISTLPTRLPILIFSFVLGIGGHAYLSLLALNGRFDGFFDKVAFNFFGG